MIKIRRNCKKIEKRKLEIKRSSKARRKLWLRNFAAKRRPLRKSHFAAKKFRSPQEPLRKPPCACCENPPWHTSAISQPGITVSQLRIGCDFFNAWRPAVSQPKHHFEGCFAAAKPPFGTRAPVRRAVRPFHSCEMGCEIDAEFSLTAKTPSRCETRASSLRKNPSAAKRNSDLWCSF